MCNRLSKKKKANLLDMCRTVCGKEIRIHQNFIQLFANTCTNLCLVQGSTVYKSPTIIASGVSIWLSRERNDWENLLCWRKLEADFCVLDIHKMLLPTDLAQYFISKHTTIIMFEVLLSLAVTNSKLNIRLFQCQLVVLLDDFLLITVYKLL